MQIITNNNKKGDSYLHKKIPPIDFKKTNRKELKDLVKIMRIAMKEASGVGLSANQIGIDKKIFIAQVRDKDGYLKFHTVINPEIKKYSKEIQNLEEGCLSVPETYGAVPRHNEITLEGLNLEGKKIKIRAWGLLAHVFQHETDHLNGILFTDKAKNLHKLNKE